MDLLTIVPVLNAFDIAQDSLRRMVLLADTPNVVAIDNGSNQPLAPEIDRWHIDHVDVVRNPENIGNYGIFKQGLEIAHALSAEIVAFIHSDLVMHEQHWDTRLVDFFTATPRAGLVGVVGSHEMDSNGGRGSGTVSNYLGIVGSRAEDHGLRLTGNQRAAVVDGCVMVFRTETLAQIGHRPDFPPHHFYDRLMSAQTLESGWEVYVVGLGCDHLGGQTAVKDPGWHAMCETWCQSKGIAKPADGGWELGVYREAERLFLHEYRDVKHLIPLRV